MREQIEAGELGVETIVKYANVLKDDLGNVDFSGFSASLTLLNNAVTGLVKTFDELGTLDNAGKGIQLIAAALNGLNDLTDTGFGEGIGNAFDLLLNPIDNVIGGIYDLTLGSKDASDALEEIIVSKLPVV